MKQHVPINNSSHVSKHTTPYQPQRRTKTMEAHQLMSLSQRPDRFQNPGFEYDFSRVNAHHSVGHLIQPKLKVSQPNDELEREADRVANAVLRKPVVRGSHDLPVLSRSTASMRSKSTLQSKEQSLVDNVISSPGRPLDSPTRAFFEPRFRRDFSRVRVHDDARAAKSAGAIQARAYTVGEHLVFGENQFATGSTEGKQLLAHELTHVVQQGAAESTIVPEGDSITGDSTLLKQGKMVTDKTDGGHFRQAMSTLKPGRMLQKAPCPCCVNSVSISNISRIDNSTHMGHSFDATFDLQYPASGPSGRCTLEWWEKTNIPYTTGMHPNTWTDMHALVPTSPTFNPWNNRTETCGTSSPVTITDPPSLGKRPGRTVTRTLEFRIVANSMPASSASGCTNASQQVTATQVLTMVNGAPDWSASSFTTP